MFNISNNNHLYSQTFVRYNCHIFYREVCVVNNRYRNFAYQSATIVPVIASFDSEGHIKPLYVGINGESYKIESCWASYNFRNIVDFKCKVIDGDYLKPLALTYYREEGMWTIPNG